MTTLVQRLGRQRLIGAALVAASLIVLAVSVLVIITSLQGDDPGLPSEGSLEDILPPTGEDGSYTLPGYELGRGGPQPPHGALPVRMAIPRIAADAPVVRMGLDAENVPEVPNNAGDVAWYEFSATPARQNNAVFSGHVDWQTSSGSGIPGVFYRLREMRIGDDIHITLDDGRVITYRVVGNVATDYEDPNIGRVMSPVAEDVITLITCGGTWIKDASRGEFGGVYSHRIVVRAERVPEGVSAANLSAN